LLGGHTKEQALSSKVWKREDGGGVSDSITQHVMGQRKYRNRKKKNHQNGSPDFERKG